MKKATATRTTMLNDLTDDRARQPRVILDTDLVAAVASGRLDRLRAADIAGA